MTQLRSDEVVTIETAAIVLSDHPNLDSA